MTTDELPAVSIGLPVYNGENYLDQTLQCLLSQTWSDFELIISDNGSTVTTSDISRLHAEADKRVRTFQFDENVGAWKNFCPACALCFLVSASATIV